MTTDRRRTPIRPAIRYLGWLAVATAVILSGGCRTLIGIAVGAFTGEEVPAAPPPDRAPPPSHSAPRSDYLWGPVPGWDQYTLRVTPFQLPASLFQADPFAGACPGLRLARVEGDDPFGAARLTAELQLFDLVPSHGADLHYYRPGTVSLAGMADPFPMAPFARIPAYGSGACTSIGVPLITFGTPAWYHVLRE